MMTEKKVVYVCNWLSQLGSPTSQRVLVRALGKSSEGRLGGSPRSPNDARRVGVQDELLGEGAESPSCWKRPPLLSGLLLLFGLLLKGDKTKSKNIQKLLEPPKKHSVFWGVLAPLAATSASTSHWALMP